MDSKSFCNWQNPKWVYKSWQWEFYQENWFQRQSAGTKEKRQCKKTIKFVWFFSPGTAKVPWTPSYLTCLSSHLQPRKYLWECRNETYSHEIHGKEVTLGVMVCGGDDTLGFIITAIGQVAEEMIQRCHNSVPPLNKPHNLYNLLIPLFVTLDVPQLHKKWLHVLPPHPCHLRQQ